VKNTRLITNFSSVRDIIKGHPILGRQIEFRENIGRRVRKQNVFMLETGQIFLKRFLDRDGKVMYERFCGKEDT